MIRVQIPITDDDGISCPHATTRTAYHLGQSRAKTLVNQSKPILPIGAGALRRPVHMRVPAPSHTATANNHSLSTKGLPATGQRPSNGSSVETQRIPEDQSALAPIVVSIGGVMRDVTAFAAEHPGGIAVLRKYQGKDATKAFLAAGHSKHAADLLDRLPVITHTGTQAGNSQPVEAESGLVEQVKKRARWKKLFTFEDRFNIHKTLGVYVLLHYAYRYTLALRCSDSTGGLAGGAVIPLLMVWTHAILSLSSLIFQVPKERVEGKPMIWSEFRAHNIIFAMRSIICVTLCWCARGYPELRTACVAGSALTVLIAQRAADAATARLRLDSTSSTTATMPYWPSASPKTIQAFKTFYAYCQYCATCACLACLNPFWPFAIMLPIQLASVLMTLVRKSILSAKGYHLLYTGSLLMPFFVGLRDPALHGHFATLLALSAGLFSGRRAGFSKQALWVPVCIARIAAVCFLGV